MDKLWKMISLTLALAALVVVLFQRVAIGRLEERLESAETDRTTRAAAPATDRTALLERRVADLEQTLARVAGVALARGGSGRAPGGAEAARRAPADPDPGARPDGDRVSRLREDVDALLTGEALGTEQGRKQLHQVVRKAQEEFWQEQRQQWRSMREQLHKERIKDLARQAGLSASQQERLGTLIDEERTRRRALMRTAREGQLPLAQAMTSIRGLRKETDQKVKELLDSKQYEQYETMRSERPRWH